MEELESIKGSMQRQNGSVKLTDEKGEPMVYDEEKSLFITDLVIDKEGTVCALVPLGHFSDDTIQYIEKLVS
ncbi:hypothetical protein DW228_06375 [Bacteroides fragilis]|uniref:Uncharacterized protein n=1 Tax=Bacteroides fragilis TaxID=817 RepID=A0A396C5R1_BACFG|nr:hypothetical protein [Bacteroides fragilis]RHH14423.1 hypothetical protein DW228_06375 [Bacteroides fragilis]